MTVGTPSYMAPEQAVASKNIGPWTDLYSVGVMAYEHLTGRPPFCDAAAAIILFRHVNEPIRPATEVVAGIDRELSAWVERLLAKDPRKRTRSPVTAWEELEDIVVRRMGALWRRQARLPSPTRVRGTSRPLTPAPFESPSAFAPGPAQEAGSPTGYVTFGHAEAKAAQQPVTAKIARAPLSEKVERLCAQLADAVSDAEARERLKEIQRDLADATDGQSGAESDAARAASAVERIEGLPLTQPDRRLVRDRIEQLCERGAEMQLVRVARWWTRCTSGDVELPAAQGDELRRLLAADSPGSRVGLDDAASERDVRQAAHRRALAWRAYEGSAAASPMARRLAADVVRFYEETSTAGEEGEA
jgi:hypothetical protein